MSLDLCTQDMKKMDENTLLPSCLWQITNGLEWTLFTDLQLKEIMHSQSWTLMVYLPYACVSHHLRFASLNWANIQFPTVMQEV